MNKKQKAIADCAIGILSNVSVVGIALALYENKWGSLAIGTFTAIAAFVIAWRSNND